LDISHKLNLCRNTMGSKASKPESSAKSVIQGMIQTRYGSPHLIDALVAQPAFLFGFQTGLRQLQAVFPSHFRFRCERNPLSAMPTHLGHLNRLLLITKGRLYTMLAQRLLCAPGQIGIRHLALGTCILSQRHTIRIVSIDKCKSPSCVATLEGHSMGVISVAFHATLPLLATGSWDKTAKLWRLSSDNSSATCVATLQGHSDPITSVAFHAMAPLLATGSEDKTAKLWRLSSDNSSATCVATLEGHYNSVYSVVFHAMAPLLATGSCDKTAKLWRLSSDNSSATCVATLAGHRKTVTSVAFHATAPLLATGSWDKTAKLWR
jgi:WD40 repeat protein